MSDADPLKTLWSNQKDEPMAMNADDIRVRAQKFDATIGWRNAREHFATGFVVLFFGYHAIAGGNPVHQAGAAAIVAAALFVSWRLWAQARPRRADSMADSWFTRYRAELVRQRDVLRTVWQWYASPFAPGMLMMIAARHVYPAFKLDDAAAWQAMAWPLAFVGAIFGGVIWLNHVAARSLQADIDELDRANRG